MSSRCNKCCIACFENGILTQTAPHTSLDLTVAFQLYTKEKAGPVIHKS